MAVHQQLLIPNLLLTHLYVSPSMPIRVFVASSVNSLPSFHIHELKKWPLYLDIKHVYEVCCAVYCHSNAALLQFRKTY